MSWHYSKKFLKENATFESIDTDGMAWTVEKLLQKATNLQEACLQDKNEADAKAREREFEEVLDMLNEHKGDLEQ